MLKIDITKMVPVVARLYTLRVMVLPCDMQVYNYLEDVLYDGKPGEIVLKGTVGEDWIIPAKKLSKYCFMDGSDINMADLEHGRWYEIQTRDSAAITWMVQIPLDQTGEVTTGRGDVLKVNRPGVPHAEGDWIACSDDGGKPTLEWGAWVVNGAVVKNTYKPA